MRLFRCWSDGAVGAVGAADERDEGDDGGGSTGDDGCCRGWCDTPNDGARHDDGTSCDWKSWTRETSHRTLKNRKNRSSSLNLWKFVFGCVYDLTAPAESSCRGVWCQTRRSSCPGDDDDGLSSCRHCESYGEIIGGLFRASCAIKTSLISDKIQILLSPRRFLIV